MAENSLIPKLDLRDIINLNVRLLEIFGYFHPDWQKPSHQFLYHIYATTFVGFIFIIYIVTEIVNIIKVFGDVEQMTNASFLLLTHLVQALKIIYLNKYYSRIRNLIQAIDRKEFQPKTIEQYRKLKKDITMSKTITKVFLALCVVTCILWGTFPFLDTKGTGKLPLGAWYPFRIDRSPAFELTYAYQVVGSAINGMANATIDTLFSGLIMVVAGQLTNLNDSLKNMLQHAKKQITLSEKTKHASPSPELQKEMNKFFTECVIHHKCILEFANEFTNLFTISILGQFAVSVVIICITMFQITLVPLVSLQFISLSMYQCGLLVEIFLVCYFGNEAILESMELTKSAYNCDWTGGSKEFKRNLLFFMTRSQMSLKLYAGGFFTLSLETFVTIVKSSWSYFAVLNRVHDK